MERTNKSQSKNINAYREQPIPLESHAEEPTQRTLD
jgi:hypothetical protein